MSISSEITRISNAKTAIASSIKSKGVTVPSGTAIDGMSALIDKIETGGVTVLTKTLTISTTAPANTASVSFRSTGLSSTTYTILGVFSLTCANTNVYFYGNGGTDYISFGTTSGYHTVYLGIKNPTSSAQTCKFVFKIKYYAN